MRDFQAIATIVDDAARFAKAIPQLSLSGHDLDLDEAYRVQAASLARRYQRGETPSGVKMGFTSRAKQIQMGLSDMIWGRLTDAMRVEDGGEIELADYVHPRAEPEIAFLLKKPLSGKVTLVEAMNCVEAIAPAIEIIDSRYEGFKFNLPDVVADNTSSSSYVTGSWFSPATDISNLGMSLEINGRPVQVGSSAAILNHPARALAAASRLLAEQNLELEAGWILMAGGATAAQALMPGDHVRLQMQELGMVGFSVAAAAKGEK
ncbi:4-oxalocrotonate decarboxylase [Croceicoccus estronivorus]|uniref:2-keto-4-pentenoate hydratase n=1 Tax=Croceicoccus estronivorus TaxID=1172626 RepID=UPI000832C078|nr:fumarylacetoacetate hydrolase family protein [Croceicoccus estronivorus]OCC23729.1 4-oxalocrotonate decarboxylase [Croceicoccus estronivorus]